MMKKLCHFLINPGMWVINVWALYRNSFGFCCKSQLHRVRKWVVFTASLRSFVFWNIHQSHKGNSHTYLFFMSVWKSFTFFMYYPSFGCSTALHWATFSISLSSRAKFGYNILAANYSVPTSVPTDTPEWSFIIASVAYRLVYGPIVRPHTEPPGRGATSLIIRPIIRSPGNNTLIR